MPNPVQIADARNAGEDAFENGEARDSCPHSRGRLREAWLEGFDAAETRAVVEDADNEMYGDDAPYLRNSGWLDR